MKRQSLWQVSVTIPREAEEATAGLLERLFGKSAVVYAGDGELVSIATVYSEEPADRVLSKREALEAGLQFLSSCDLELGVPRIAIRKVRVQDWATSWKRHFRTLRIGSALIIRPSWSRLTPRKGQAVVILDPGLSFGTGQHPTTAYCLEQLVHVHKSGQTRSFLDIGTGSGILAIAAAKLGFSPVRAFDEDPIAVRIAKANARKNRVDKKVVISREDLTEATLTPRFRYDLICANLSDVLLVREMRRILARLLPGGRLALAGMLAKQFSSVQEAYEGAGLRLDSSRVEGDWASGVFVARAGG